MTAGGLAARVGERIRRSGPISFADFMETALYGEGGFYSGAGGAGRRRDFLTSPEVGGLFGAVLARAIDSWWQEAGRPDPFVVAEAGAGSGTLARAILDAQPKCGSALRYVLVERSEARREEQRARLTIDPPAHVLGPPADPADEDGGAADARATGTGPFVTALADLPAEPFSGVILANELLDNLPFRLVERADGGWLEVRIGLDQGALAEVLVPAPADLAAECDALAPNLSPGDRLPLQHEASRWLQRALDLVPGGRVVLFDYAGDTAELARRGGWLRTYRGHGPGGSPLSDPGDQDITADVAVDQLARIRRPDRVRIQAEFLAEHGIADLAAAARRAWQERAHVGDLAALAARSRAGEEAALTDPSGLGAFLALEWTLP